MNCEIKKIIKEKFIEQKEIFEQHLIEHNKSFEIIDSKIKMLDKYLCMIQNRSNINKKEVKNFYMKEIDPIIISTIQSFCINNSSHEILRYKNQIKENKKSVSWIVRDCKNALCELSKKSMEKYIKSKILKYRKLISSIDNDTYYKEDEIFKVLIDTLVEFKLDTKYPNIINDIKIMHDKYVKEVEVLEKNRKIILETKMLEIKNNVPKIKEDKKQTTKYYFDKSIFFTVDDDILLSSARKIVYDNKYLIENLDNNSYEFICKCLEFSDEEIIEMQLLDTNKLQHYRILVIIYELNLLLSKIDNFIKIIIENKMFDEQIKNIIPKKDKVMIQINELYNKFLSITNIDTRNENLDIQKKHMIYMLNSSGSTYFESNIINSNSVAEEYYPSFLRMLNDIEKGIITKNSAKDGKYNNNGKLKNNIYKKKDFSSRIQYIMIDDIVFILTGFVKKTDNSLYDMKSLIRMDDIATNQISNIIEAFKDPIKKEEILKTHKKIHTKIKNTLKNKARGKIKDLTKK